MSHNATSFFIDRHVELGKGDRTAIVHAGGQVTYASLARAVNEAGEYLRRLGVQPEQRVALLLNDCPEFIYFFMGALKIGAVAVPVSTFCSPDLLTYYLNDTRAPVLVTHQAYREKVTQARGTALFLQHIVYAEAPEWRLPIPSSEAFPVCGDDSAFWLYTSGSTGPQKGVVHRHASMMVCAQQFGQTVLGISESDRCYSTSKLFFAYGLGNSVIFPFSVGGTCILNEGRSDCETVAGLIEKYRPTLFFSVPTLYRQLLGCTEVHRELFSSVRMCVSAGEYLPVSIYEAWSERTAKSIYDGIGTTETMHIFCSNRDGALRSGTSGVPVEGYDLEIVDDHGRLVSPNEPGRLRVRGKTLGKGYWNKYDATQKSFQGEWLSTGDIYRQTEDGFYQYVGRQDDVFKSNGLWVSPSEIEQVLLSHRNVQEAAVVAVQSSAGLFVAKAFVVPKEGVTDDAAGDLRRDIYAFLDGRLSKYKVPESIVVLAALPKTATGKVARADLRQMP